MWVYIDGSGQERRLPHHRTGRMDWATMRVLLYHLSVARYFWLKMKEGAVERVEDAFRKLVKHLAYALHLVQDLVIWSMPEPQHSEFEEEMARIYKSP